MDQRTQGALLLAVGGVALRLGFSDEALAYVRPGLRPLLAVSGVVLAVLGAAAVLRAFRAELRRGRQADEIAAPAEDVHGHRHGHGPAVAWFLVLPVLSLLLVAPPPLGAFAANRGAEFAVVDTRTDYGPLPPELAGAVPLSLTDFVLRANYDDSRSLEGARVRLTGFVSDTSTGEGYQLSRFIVSCCAADARPVDVVLVDEKSPPPVDTWLEVEGTWRPRDVVEAGELPAGPPVLEVAASQPIEPPRQPYEY